MLKGQRARVRRNRNPIDVRAGLWVALLGAVALYLWSRTSTGSAMVGKVVSGAMDAVRDLTAPRGIRNHNPGNIERTSDRWQGMSADQSPDARFVVFDAPVWGLRALRRVLRSYVQQGYTTVAEVIGRWAPPHENITSAYVNAVAAQAGLDPHDPIPDAAWPSIMAAIVQHENGRQPYPPELFAQAVELERTT